MMINCTLTPPSPTAKLRLRAVMLFVVIVGSTQFASAQTPALSAQQTNTQLSSVNTGQIRYGTGLGRLLTSERERSKIDDLRFKVVEPVKTTKEEIAQEEAPKLLRIDGISHRPDRPVGQRTSIWIDGKVFAENELPYGLSIVRNAKGEVIGLNSVVSKGKTEFAKIGDQLTSPQTLAQARAIELAASQPKKPAETSVEKP